MFAEIKYDPSHNKHDAPGRQEKPQTQIMRVCLSYMFKIQYTEANKAMLTESACVEKPITVNGNIYIYNFSEAETQGQPSELTVLSTHTPLL